MQDLDYKQARIMFAEKIKSLGYTIESTPIPSRPNWTGDKYTAHVAFTITHGPSGRTHQGQYSAGSWIVLDWAKTHRLELNKPGGIGWPHIQPRDLENIKLGGRGMTMHDDEILTRLKAVYRPSVETVMASLFADASYHALGMTFREFCDEGTTEGQSPADALDVFQAIEATANYLRRTAGIYYDSLIELAGQL